MSRECSIILDCYNTELTDKHSRDQYVNLLLETANDKRNGVILLEMNVRTKFV